jgi:hypothetical protein
MPIIDGRRAALVLACGALCLGACTGSATSGPSSGEGGAGLGGDTGSGGSPGAGGSGTGGGPGAGGSGAGGIVGGTGGSSGGVSGTGGSAGRGATTGTGGAATGTGGRGGTGGVTTSTGGAAGGLSGTGGAPPAIGCNGAAVTLNPHPFGCSFAWGEPDGNGIPGTVKFVSAWVGDETNGGLASFSATATNNSCGDCSTAQQVAPTSSTLVLYTYFIGFQACRQGGFCDCNTDTDGHTLCTDGAQWIRANRATIVNMYAQYAKKINAASPNKPVVWWLEGDFVQYSYAAQSSPLTYLELGSLARDITCAIKAGEPNAVVAMNHSPWITNDQANGFWNAQPVDVLDGVWVQGAGDTGVFLNSAAYNAATASYAWLHQRTGKPIMVETSFAGAGVSDRWTDATAAEISQRISEGVIGVHVNAPASNYTSVTATLSSQLGSVCQ